MSHGARESPCTWQGRGFRVLQPLFLGFESILMTLGNYLQRLDKGSIKSCELSAT